MKRLIITLLLCWAACLTSSAQYLISDNYTQWFGEDSNVILRKAVYCNEDGQDLWNGCYVRKYSGYVYIYSGNNRILYGNEIWLMYNGYWIVGRNGYEYLYTPEGNYANVHGEEILAYPWDNFVVRLYSDIWYVYRSDGSRLDFYSNGQPLIYRNGCWAAKHGSYYYGYDENGRRLDGVYGDEIYLMQDGRWRCTTGSYVFYR